MNRESVKEMSENVLCSHLGERVGQLTSPDRSKFLMVRESGSLQGQLAGLSAHFIDVVVVLVEDLAAWQIGNHSETSLNAMYTA